MQRHKAILILSILLFLNSCKADLDNSFDYLKQGLDWSDTNCVSVSRNIAPNLSPLDLNTTAGLGFPHYYYFLPVYTLTDATINNLNITLELNSTDYGSVYTITAGNQVGVYQAVSMRFHSEAEHTFNTTRYPIELQIYHTLLHSSLNATKYQANLFVSVFFDYPSPDVTNATNDLLANITNALNNQDPTVSIDLSYLFDLSATRDMVYSYGGTQTIPPCNPASWLVFPKPFIASKDQIDAIYNLYHNNPKFAGNGNYRQIPTIQSGTPVGYYLLNNQVSTEISA